MLATRGRPFACSPTPPCHLNCPFEIHFSCACPHVLVYTRTHAHKQHARHTYILLHIRTHDCVTSFQTGHVPAWPYGHRHAEIYLHSTSIKAATHHCIPASPLPLFCNHSSHAPFHYRTTLIFIMEAHQRTSGDSAPCCARKPRGSEPESLRGSASRPR